MGQTMIALVSDQRMQNLTPLFQQGQAYSRLILVLSKERATGYPAKKFKDIAGHIAVVAKQAGVATEVYDTFVDPFRIEDSERVVTKCIETAGCESSVDVNFTGGTKLMAVGAWLAAKNQGQQAVYVDTENGELLWLYPDGTCQADPIRIRNFGIDFYIEAYGEQVCKKAYVADLDPSEIEWAQAIAKEHAVIYPVVNRLNQQTKMAQKTKSGYPVRLAFRPTRRQKDLIERLAAIGLWEWDVTSSTLSLPNRERADFLNGRWVESYTASSLAQSGCFDEVALNITLRDIEGEIDVAVIRNGRLALFECKSNVQRSQQLAKLDSFRKNLGGSYALAFYVRASDANAKQVKRQAQKWRMNYTFLGSELTTLADTVAHLMETMP